MPSDRRARKRERKARGDDGAYLDALPEYIRSRIVCDRCGLDQPFRHGFENGGMAPCDGPLGLSCESEAAIFLDSWEEMTCVSS